EQRDGSVALAGFGGSPAFPPEQAREALAGARLTAGGGAAPRLPRELRRFSALERLREVRVAARRRLSRSIEERRRELAAFRSEARVAQGEDRRGPNRRLHASAAAQLRRELAQVLARVGPALRAQRGAGREGEPADDLPRATVHPRPGGVALGDGLRAGQERPRLERPRLQRRQLRARELALGVMREHRLDAVGLDAAQRAAGPLGVPRGEADGVAPELAARARQLLEDVERRRAAVATRGLERGHRDREAILGLGPLEREETRGAVRGLFPATGREERANLARG